MLLLSHEIALFVFMWNQLHAGVLMCKLGKKFSFKKIAQIQVFKVQEYFQQQGFTKSEGHFHTCAKLFLQLLNFITLFASTLLGPSRFWPTCCCSLCQRGNTERRQSRDGFPESFLLPVEVLISSRPPSPQLQFTLTFGAFPAGRTSVLLRPVRTERVENRSRHWSLFTNTLDLSPNCSVIWVWDNTETCFPNKSYLRSLAIRDPS